ncbi:MAG: hypothetical protein PHH49_08210 [Candidatus Omnitrophica bacterium]|nr:hypothetical protein [Candidatus Omnitrophota bacterium]MDD5488921.1 hypothetical protein [Candidatus Omnitrophota bacterium]
MGRPRATKCPECGDIIEIDPYAEDGEMFYCPSCDAELEIVSVQPLKLRSKGGAKPGKDRDSEEDDYLEEDPDDGAADDELDRYIDRDEDYETY